MMKKISILSLSFLIFTSLNIFAQEETEPVKKESSASKASEDPDRLKPVDGNWGFTFNLNGLINNLSLESNKDMVGNEILFIRKYLKDDLALRVGFGLNSTRQTSRQKDSLGLSLVESDSVFSKTDFLISAGVEKHLGHMKRLDPYIGGEVSLQFIGREKNTWNKTISEPIGNTMVEGEYKLDGGTGYGAFAILGFNYFITKNIALGAEYRFGYNYVKMGGVFSESVRVTPPTGSATTAYKQGIDEQKVSGFEVNSTGNVVFSIFF